MQSKHRSPALFHDFNTLQFASVLGMVVFVVLLVFMVIPAHGYGHGISVNLPKASHSVSMSGASSEDAMRLYIMRDGKVYFGSDQIDPAYLPQKITERLKDPGVERKVYIAADMRAPWGGVRQVLDGVHSSGILRIAFLVNQR